MASVADNARRAPTVEESGASATNL